MGTNTMALIQTCQIQAITAVPQRLSFSAQLSNCNLATCWHIELSILGLLHLSISIHSSNTFNGSMKFFLGLALGESCVASATIEKHGCPMSTFSYFRGKAFLGKPATITFPIMSNSGHHDSSTQAVFLCTADKLQCCHMLAHWTQHTGPSHTTFIRAKASVVLSSSFVWK